MPKAKQHNWPGRSATLALIKAAAEAGVEIELEDHPNFRLIPGKPVVVDAPPSKRPSATFKRPAHMRGLRSWSPAGLGWGPDDYTIPMAGDDPDLTFARGEWSQGNPAPLREYLARKEQTGHLFFEK